MQRVEQIARWIELTAAKQAEISEQVAQKSKTVSNPKGAGRNEGGINGASRERGIDRFEAYRAIDVAGLTDEAAWLCPAVMNSVERRFMNMEQWNTCQEPIDKQNKSDRGGSWGTGVRSLRERTKSLIPS